MNKTFITMGAAMLLLGCDARVSSTDVSPPPPEAKDLDLSVSLGSSKELSFEWVDIGSDDYVLCRDLNGVCDELAVVAPSPVSAVAASSGANLAAADSVKKIQYSHYFETLLSSADSDAFYVRARANDTILDSEEVVFNYKEFNGLVGRYVPKSPVEWQNQGHVVAISGDGKTKAITTLTSGDPDVNSGEVTVYSRVDGSWEEVTVLRAPFSSADPLTGFGIDLDLDDNGETIVVGSWKQTVSGVEEAGAAYVFKKSEDGSWGDFVLIENPVPSAKDFFAFSLSLSGEGDWLAIGAYNEDSSGTDIVETLPADDAYANSGVVYLYGWNDVSSAWDFKYAFKAPNADKNDFFGRKVRLSKTGDILLVTANGEDSYTGAQEDNSVPSVGAGYVFRKQSDRTWAFDGYLKSPLPIKQGEFGKAAAISYAGDVIVIGVSKESDVASPDHTVVPLYGAVHIWAYDGSAWVHQARLTASNAEDGDSFGTSVALGNLGKWLAVGAQYEDSGSVGLDGDQSDNSVMNSGAAYIYEYGNTWVQTHYIKSLNPTEKSYLGKSVAFSPIAKELAISAPSEMVERGDDEVNAGIVYLF